MRSRGAYLPREEFKVAISPLDPKVLAVVEAGLKINFPPENFDPLHASAQELDKYFFPPRPDAVKAPTAYQLWAHAMSPPRNYPKMPEKLEAMLASNRSRSRPLRTSASGIVQEASQNWSGTYVRPRDFNPMVLVQGQWKVPKPSAPAGSGDGTYASSIWVGLDGHDPASRSLPQLGTAQRVKVKGGVAKRYLEAWWQWWDRDDPLGQQIAIKNFPVKPKDEIYAQVQALTPTLVSLFIKNMTTGLTLPMWYEAPPPPASGRINILPVHVEGRTADWIVERPAIPNTNPPQPYVLADYGSTTFSNCNAASGSVNGLNEQLQRSRLIEMNVWDEPAHPGVLVSHPARVNSTTLKVDYVP